MKERLVPVIPEKEQRLKMIIDSDVANEIDDLYAIAIALSYPERFDLLGFVATHFATGGPTGIERSYELMLELLREAGFDGVYPVKRGSAPMQYTGCANDSEGVDFIIETARACSPEDPLWVVAIGAATNLACAVLKAPDILPNVRYVFHGRSETTWPERSTQYNIYGDIIATKTLLESDVPLVWFDTGTYICATYETTRERLAPISAFGKYLHDFRDRNPYFALGDKGFFDMGDFAFLLDPSTCECEIIDAPEITRYMYFKHNGQFGKMLRVHSVSAERTWDIFYKGLERLLQVKTSRQS